MRAALMRLEPRTQIATLTACAAAILAYRARRANGGRRVGTLILLAAALVAAYLVLRKRRALLQDADTTADNAPPSEASRERPRSAAPVDVLPSNAVIVHNVDTAVSEASELQTLLSRELAGEVVMAASWHHDLSKLEALVKKPRFGTGARLLGGRAAQGHRADAGAVSL